MIVIKNIKWPNADFSYIQDLKKILCDSMKDLNIKINCVVDSGSIVFKEVEPGKTFISLVDNKRILKDPKKREALMRDKGRAFLKTKIPTLKQTQGFISTIQDSLDEFGLVADVEYSNKKGVSCILRNKDGKYDVYPKQPSYPSEM